MLLLDSDDDRDYFFFGKGVNKAQYNDDRDYCYCCMLIAWQIGGMVVSLLILLLLVSYGLGIDLLCSCLVRVFYTLLVDVH